MCSFFLNVSYLSEPAVHFRIFPSRVSLKAETTCPDGRSRPDPFRAPPFFQDRHPHYIFSLVFFSPPQQWFRRSTRRVPKAFFPTIFADSVKTNLPSRPRPQLKPPLRWQALSSKCFLRRETRVSPSRQSSQNRSGGLLFPSSRQPFRGTLNHNADLERFLVSPFYADALSK